MASPSPADDAHHNGSPVLAVDPGRDKCGLAVVGCEDGNVVILDRCIIAPEEVTGIAGKWAAQYGVSCLLIGDSTTSKRMANALRETLPGLPLHLVNEKGSTLDARSLYWEANPPRGWRKVMPLSLQEPPEPIDDFAAVVLARRYFEQG